IVVEKQLAVQRRKYLMVLGGEGCECAMLSTHSPHEIGAFDSEEPNRTFILTVTELRSHGLAVVFIDTGQAEHERHVGLERLPEFFGNFCFAGHGVTPSG